jgi:hypothetical protein
LGDCTQGGKRSRQAFADQALRVGDQLTDGDDSEAESGATAGTP